MCSGRQLAIAESRARRRAPFLFFEGGGKLSPTHPGYVGDNGISGMSFSGYHGSAPCDSFAWCRPIGEYIVF